MQNTIPVNAEQPLVSIIVPVYNVERYIDECIQCLVAQTHENIEIILVDDGSTDKSGTICDEWALKDSRINVIHHQNGGPGRARNKGLAAASGDYIAFADGDDRCDPVYIETLLGILRAFQTDISLCSYDHIDDSGQTSALQHIAEEDVADAAQLVSGLLDDTLFSAPWGKLFRAEIAKFIHFDEKVFIGEDVRMWNNLIKKGIAFSFTSIDQPLYHYRNNTTSIIHSYHADQEASIVETWDALCDTALSKYGERVLPQARFRRAWMRFEVLDRAIDFGESTSRDYCDDAVSYLREHAGDVYASAYLGRKRHVGMHILSFSKPLYIKYRHLLTKLD